MRAFKIFLAVLFVVVSLLYGYTTISNSIGNESIPPVLRSDREILEVSVHDDESMLYTGITASDEQDGDLTGKVQISGISKLINNNTAKITYLVFDSDHNLATLTRQVRYTDYIPPRFAINKPLIYYRNESIMLLDRITVTDVLDGDITSSIRVSSLTSTSDPETYQLTCQVTNSMGDTVFLTLPVIQMDGNSIRPEVKLSSYLVYLTAGSNFNPRTYLTGITTPDGQGSVSDVTISGTVDTSTPGTYMVRYAYPFDGMSASSILTVVVE